MSQYTDVCQRSAVPSDDTATGSWKSAATGEGAFGAGVTNALGTAEVDIFSVGALIRF